MNLIKLILCACCVLFTGNFEVDSYDLVELNKVGENRGNSCDQKEPLRRLRRDVAPPSEGQTSLVFIFDDTGSMHDDLKELRKGAKKITQEFANRENNPIYDYILVRFNDPSEY